ncbi:DUF167 domain-containing protein [Candidatus Dojkabacteria bacterium]|nr:DUF167 domain-containing protein [Candidatus Dojkabacteria bacterium]
MIIDIVVKPLSGTQEIIPIDSHLFKVKLKNSPEKNRANLELIKLLSKYFKVPRAGISIIKGIKDKHKKIQVEEM